jgi:hypothetical protein
VPLGVVIDYLAHCIRGPFCIQDADCFVTDASFWDSMTLNPAIEYAVCAFTRSARPGMPEFPETFLVCLNSELIRRYRKEYGMRSESAGKANARAKRILSEAGYSEGKVLEKLKDYYDTLQQFWLVATHHGFQFRRIEGEGEVVHHIGGTSYLHRSFENLEHWDYWPLAVHYLNLRILEIPATALFRERFSKLIAFHGSADQLLDNFPDFASGWRRKLADRILLQLATPWPFAVATGK